MATPLNTRQSAAIASQVMTDLLKNREFADLLESIVGNAIEKKLGDFMKTVDVLKGEVFDLKRDLEEKNKEMKNLEEKVIKLEQGNSRLENSINNQEQYSRRSCIRIFGLEEKRGENTDMLAADIIRTKLEVTLDPIKDIDRSHRTGSPREPARPVSSSRSANDASGFKPRPRPIIVKLTSYRKRREIIEKRKLLKGTGIVIVEDLTLKNQKLLSLTRNAPNVKSAWSSDGRVIALLAASGGKDITKLITCEDDLKKIH